MSDRVRLNIYLKPEVADRVKAMAEKLGMSHSATASLAVNAGIDALSMALDPEFQKYFEEKANDLATNRTKSPK